MPPEPKGNRTLSDEDVRARALARLAPLLPEPIGGYRVDRTMLLDALLYAATEGTSLHGASANLVGLADDTTLRDYLNVAWPAESVMALQQRVNDQMVADLPESIRGSRRHVAIDTKDYPYYGHCPELAPWVCRGKARSGTTRFLRVATAYLMLDGLRLTLGIRFVGPTHRMADIVTALVTHVRFVGVRTQSLWLDRGFASVAVVRAIERLRLPAVIACPIRGKDTTGTRALCRGPVSYTAHHTFVSQRDGVASVQIAACRSFIGGRRSPKRTKWLLYVVIGQRLTPAAVHGAYRLRFGIESSYRVSNQVRPRTTSRNPAVRFLMASIGFMLTDVWVLLRFANCARILPARGFRRAPQLIIDEDGFRLLRFKAFVRHALETRYEGRWSIIATEGAT